MADNEHEHGKSQYTPEQWAIHREQEAIRRFVADHWAEYATAMAAVIKDIQEIRSDLKRIEETIDGRVVGTLPVPGLVQLVHDLERKMDSIRRVLIYVGTALIANVGIQVLHDFWPFH